MGFGLLSIAPMMALSFLSSLGFIAVIIYVVSAIKNGKREPGAKDTQLGLKAVLLAILLLSTLIAVAGAYVFVWYLLSGTKAGADAIKAGLALLLGGGGVAFAIYVLFLPRTNFRVLTDGNRITVGIATFIFGIAALVSVVALLLALFNGFDGPWEMNSMFLTAALLFGALFYLSTMAFGKMSHWVAPVRPARPMNPPGGAGGMGGPNPGMPQQGVAPQGQPPGAYQTPPAGSGYQQPGPQNPYGGPQQGQ